jgi:hypothetical protein
MKSTKRDMATADAGKVRLGDGAAPSFGDDKDGKKIARDAATSDAGKVRLGDSAPPFAASATRDEGKVRLGDGGIGAF